MRDGLKRNILAAARADAIPKGSRGLWFITKFETGGMIEKPTTYGRKYNLPAGRYTQLWRLTTATMMKRPPGDLVMSDTGDELESHLDFMMRAHGDVLVTGLGLGCVARGCLANPFVKRVTVIEKDSCVLRLVAPHMPRDPRLRIVHADALQYVDVLCSQPLVRQFDCAWHDLWADDDDENGKALQLMHACMIRDLVYANRVTHFQGGWNLPRWFRRGLRRKFGPSIL